MYKLFFDTDCDITPEVAKHYNAGLISMPYVIDEEFFAGAEYEVSNVLNSELTAGEVEDFEIVSLRQSTLKEIDEQSRNDALPSFITTLRDIFHDDDGNEKQLKYKVLLWAANLTEANTRANLLSHQGYDMLVEGIKQVDYMYLDKTNTQEASTEEEKDELQ